MQANTTDCLFKVSKFEARSNGRLTSPNVLTQCGQFLPKTRSSTLLSLFSSSHNSFFSLRLRVISMSPVVLTKNTRTIFSPFTPSAAAGMSVSVGGTGTHIHLLHIHPIFNTICIQPWTPRRVLVWRDGLVGWNGLIRSDGLVWGDGLVWCHWCDGLVV
ncbi:hypothetical protein E2C01_015831 [Portunus trituberculatus]|uniref:Uncharacterized protein n=1 Tax=Portunus trituberculatus TaxID=210409 RepID=A0A5B7DP32_PORTR|nr:hypothetical protein [Portunus trituberculatus]